MHEGLLHLSHPQVYEYYITNGNISSPYLPLQMFTILFKDLELSDEYFSRLDKSLLTLFEMMTMEWSDVARECMETYIWAGPLIIVFVILSGFIVFNLIVAVV